MGGGVAGLATLDSLERLDAQLSSVVREEAGLRLRLGQVLEVMQRKAYCFELGFSSLAAYALERCERSARWTEVACCLARRLEALPLLRGAVAMAQVSWSMGELLARVAKPEEEARWLALAQRHTLREMRLEVMRARGIAGCHTGRVQAGSAIAQNGVVQNDVVQNGVIQNGVLESRIPDGIAPNGIAPDGVTQNCGGSQNGVALMQDYAGTCTLTFTLDREEAWLLEATRSLLQQLGTQNTDEQLEALLAEGQGALLAALPVEGMDLPERKEDAAQQRWRDQLARWREEAEQRCESHIRALVLQRSGVAAAAVSEESSSLQAAQGLESLDGSNSGELDRVARELAAALAGHELRLSQLLWRFHRAEGWRRLGYATETQYARERLGLSRSSLIARRCLALRLAALPHITAALGRAEIGVEAALQLVRIATPRTELAWLGRARLRTVKHLREEVAAALTVVRVSGDIDCPPPESAELEGFQELERAVLSGRVWGGAPNRREPGCTAELKEEPLGGNRPVASRRPWQVMLGSLTAWLAQGALQNAVRTSAESAQGAQLAEAAQHGLQNAVRMSAESATEPLDATMPDATMLDATMLDASRRPRSAGRVVVRWRVSTELRSWWYSLEARARRWLPRGMSWVKYLCLVFWQAWNHMLGSNVAWGQVYLRDRFRCSSPVCSRRDVTPHHLQFRSAGGGDHDGNMTSLCTWCHLFGVHGGRIRAVGSAGHIVWELGSRGQACVRVDGRERVAAVSG